MVVLAGRAPRMLPEPGAGGSRGCLGVDLHRDGALAVPQDLHGHAWVDVAAASMDPHWPIAGDLGEDVGVIDEAEPFGCPRDLIGGLCKGGRGELGQLRVRGGPQWDGFSGAGIP